MPLFLRLIVNDRVCDRINDENSIFQEKALLSHNLFRTSKTTTLNSKEHLEGKRLAILAAAVVFPSVFLELIPS